MARTKVARGISKRKGSKKPATPKITHCFTCKTDLSEDMSHVDWFEVNCRTYGSDDCSSDPCDDCCCGACGLRKVPYGNSMRCAGGC